VCRRTEGRLAEDFNNTTFSLVVFARSAVMQQKSFAFIFCRGDAGEFRLAVELNVKSEKGYTSPGTETEQPTILPTTILCSCNHACQIINCVGMGFR